ncbi:sce7726 family protein [Bisgaard Taxon 45]
MIVMNEIAIREKLQRFLARKHRRNTEFLAELPIADFSRRVDLVMANGKLSGFEIKSEQDSLKRLDGQLSTYIKYFEEVFVVCATKHLKGVFEIAPISVGVLEFDGKSFVLHRSPITNLELEKEHLLNFLNVVGLKALLRAHNLKVSGLKSELVSRALSLPHKNIRLFILSYLKEKFPIMIQERNEIKVRKSKREACIRNNDDTLGLIPKVVFPRAPEILSKAEIARREKIKILQERRRHSLQVKFGDSYECLP